MWAYCMWYCDGLFLPLPSKAILFYWPVSKWTYFAVYNKPITRLITEEAVVRESSRSQRAYSPLCDSENETSYYVTV